MSYAVFNKRYRKYVGKYELGNPWPEVDLPEKARQWDDRKFAERVAKALTYNNLKGVYSVVKLEKKHDR